MPLCSCVPLFLLAAGCFPPHACSIFKICSWLVSSLSPSSCLSDLACLLQITCTFTVLQINQPCRLCIDLPCSPLPAIAAMQGFHSHPSRKCLWSLSLSFSPHLCYQTAKLVRTVGSVVATAKVVRQFQPRVSLLPSNLFVFSFWNKVDSNLHETSCLIDPKFIGEANKPCWANVKLVFELSELRLVKLSSRTRFGPFCSDQITLITRQ